MFRPRKPLENPSGLRLAYTRVVSAVQQENRTLHVLGIVCRVMGRSGKATLDSAPKDKQPGQGEMGQAHGGEAVLYRRQEPIERAFQHDCIRLYSVRRESPEDGGASHRLTVKQQAPVLPAT